MTEQEFIAIAKKQFKLLENLKEEDSFYEYEKRFDQIWVDFGKETLEKNISKIPEDRRKKKDSQVAMEK